MVSASLSSFDFSTFICIFLPETTLRRTPSSLDLPRNFESCTGPLLSLLDFYIELRMTGTSHERVRQSHRRQSSEEWPARASQPCNSSVTRLQTAAPIRKGPFTCRHQTRIRTRYSILSAGRRYTRLIRHFKGKSQTPTIPTTGHTTNPITPALQSTRLATKLIHNASTNLEWR